MKLSVVVLTGATEQAYLPLCLEMLTRQSYQNFEVLVIGDDGCAAFADRLQLRHLQHTGSRAAGYNRALAQAGGEGLVCLTAATLLNPAALRAYAAYLNRPDHQLVFGYTGTGVSFENDRVEATAANYHAPSQWFPAEQVAYLDTRIILYRPQELWSSPYLASYPHWYATGSNFAIKRHLACALPCDESLPNWRHACVDLAYRALAQGQGVDFMLDAWCEQLLQPESSAPFEQTCVMRRYPRLEAPVPARLMFTPQGRQLLLDQLFGYYFQHDAHFDAATRSQLSQPGAKLELSSDHYGQIGLYQLGERPTNARPGFLIIGAQKAGTTSLYNLLATHPSLLASRRKEIHYFNRANRLALGQDWYLDHFSFEAGKLSFEATPAYLFCRDCPELIKAFAPDIKLIAVLREPVARAYSAWNMYHRMPPDYSLYEPRSFEQVIQEALAGDLRHGYLERGKYAEQIRRYLDHFSRSQLLLLDFAELCSDPEACLTKCCAFLGLDPIVLPPNARKVYNAGGYSNTLSAQLKEQLQTWFEPHNRQLQTEFGINFNC